MAQKKLANKELSPDRYRATQRDFSRRAITGASVKSALSFWACQYPAALGTGTMIFGLLLGMSEPVFWTGMAALFAAGCGFIWKRYFRETEFERDYVRKLREEIDRETVKKREQLAADLRSQGCPEGAAQLEQLQADFDSLVELLAVKIDPAELTHQRYRGMAEEVFLSGIDNLRDALAALMSVDEIDEREVLKRISLLEKEPASSKLTEEIDVLRRRLTLKKEMMSKAAALLSENERAITHLEETAALIAGMDTGLSEGKVGMENSMNDLIRIAERAKKSSEVQVVLRRMK